MKPPLILRSASHPNTDRMIAKMATLLVIAVGLNPLAHRRVEQVRRARYADSAPWFRQSAINHAFNSFLENYRVELG